MLRWEFDVFKYNSQSVEKNRVYPLFESRIATVVASRLEITRLIYVDVCVCVCVRARASSKRRKSK